MTKAMKIFKQKFIPEKIYDISDDEVIFFNNEFMITSWEATNSEMGVKKALSLTSFSNGYQISKKFNKENEFMYWYCDIVKAWHDREKNEIWIQDLIADVILFPDKALQVIDLPELVEARKNGLITEVLFQECHKSILSLVSSVIHGNFPPQQNLPKNKSDALIAALEEFKNVFRQS